jgi:chromate transport protein ChrA
MQTAAYVGFRARGVAGAAASFIGFALPAFLLMLGLSAFYARSHTLPPVVAIFNGLQTVVVAIVANATVSFGKASLKDFKDAVIAMIAAGMFGSGVSPILVIILAALLGFVFYQKKSLSGLSVSSLRQSNSARTLLIITSVAALAFVVLFFVERTLFDLAAMMFRIDLFAFGGGFASLPLMYNEVVEVRSWMDGQTFLNGIALGQITPGPDCDKRDLCGLYALWPAWRSRGNSERILAVFLNGDWSHALFRQVAEFGLLYQSYPRYIVFFRRPSVYCHFSIRFESIVGYPSHFACRCCIRRLAFQSRDHLDRLGGNCGFDIFAIG